MRAHARSFNLIEEPYLVAMPGTENSLSVRRIFSTSYEGVSDQTGLFENIKVIGSFESDMPVSSLRIRGQDHKERECIICSRIGSESD